MRKEVDDVIIKGLGGLCMNVHVSVIISAILSMADNRGSLGNTADLPHSLWRPHML